MPKILGCQNSITWIQSCLKRLCCKGEGEISSELRRFHSTNANHTCDWPAASSIPHQTRDSMSQLVSEWATSPQNRSPGSLPVYGSTGELFRVVGLCLLEAVRWFLQLVWLCVCVCDIWACSTKGSMYRHNSALGKQISRRRTTSQW